MSEDRPPAGGADPSPSRLARLFRRSAIEALVSTIARRRRLAKLARRIEEAGLIDAEWYYREYPDVARSGLRASTHFLRFGHADGRDPSAHFRTVRYRDLHPELKGAGENALLHFLDRLERERTGLASELRGGLDEEPGSVLTGRGTALLLEGWCYAPDGPVRALAVYVGDDAHQVRDHSRARPDVAERELERDPAGLSLFSGFSVVIPIPAVATPTALPLRLRARLADGATIERAVGVLEAVPGTGAVPVAAAWPGEGPRVAICMATYQPPPELFARQVASLKAQTHGNWVCVVSDDASPAFVVSRMRAMLDDPRFIFLPHTERRGFYGNFERALRAVPADAAFVALSDQDDAWYPDKIAILLASFEGHTQLATSDVRIVTRSGEVLSDTFWVTRRNDVGSLAAILSANSVIGAASLFRASLLDAILPFPQRLGGAYHDHWIALNALAAGTIRYVDRPLHDYVQHGDNVIGHKHDRDAPGLRQAARDVLRVLRARLPLAPAVRDLLDAAVVDRKGLVAQKIVLARILLARHPGLRPDARRVLRRFANLDRLVPALRERALAAFDRRPTLNGEGVVLRAVVGAGMRHAIDRARRKRLLRRLVGQRNERGVRNFMDAYSRDAPIHFTPPVGGRVIPAMHFGHVGWIFHNVAPLRLDVSPARPRHVNVLMATINFDYLFGGYIGMFNLALRLKRDGQAVRIVLLEDTRFDLAAWRAKIGAYPGLTTLFDEIEIVYRHDRSVPLTVSPGDAFVATNGWNAHVAHKATRDLGRDRFLFMIQDYEPFFGPMNTNTALLRQSYDFPQFGLFSTDLLRDFFAANRIGVFENPDADRYSAVFRNAIQTFAPTREALSRRSRRILFYARPEEHAARNMFEMGIVALSTLFSELETAPRGWSAHGIGSIGNNDSVELAPGAILRMLPKTSLQGYAAMLPDFDVGLSLMLTPHPSLVPLEMASAGLVTVTNTFANKTAARLAAISTNLIGAPPTLEGIVAGLRAAITRADDVAARLAGSRVDWPTDWGAAFDSETMAKVNGFLSA